MNAQDSVNCLGSSTDWWPLSPSWIGLKVPCNWIFSHEFWSGRRALRCCPLAIKRKKKLMYKSQKTWWWVIARHKSIHTAWFHSCKVLRTGKINPGWKKLEQWLGRAVNWSRKDQKKLSGWWKCSTPEQRHWSHGYTHLSKHIKVYTSHLSILLYVNLLQFLKSTAYSSPTSSHLWLNLASLVV